MIPREKRLSLGRRNRRTLVVGILLAAFASFALIPPGFMPASGRPFSLEICPEGLPSGMLALLEPSEADSAGRGAMGMPEDSTAAHHGGLHGAHHHTSSQSDHCVFGTACGAAPLPHHPPHGDFSAAPPLLAAALTPIGAAVRVVHLPQPRAPPARLS
jgi:hypothetical protein